MQWGKDVVAEWVNAPFGMPASHIREAGIWSCLHLDAALEGSCAWEAVDAGSGTGASGTNLGDRAVAPS